MRKLFSGFLIALTLTSFAPKAKAVGGLMIGQYVIAAIGGVSMVGSVPLFKIANKLRRSPHGKVTGLVIGIAASILWLGGGWYLDQENNDFKFMPIEKASLSADEMIYNAELDELNAVKDMVAEDLSREELNSLEEIHQFAKQKWNEYGSALSPATLRVRAQIVNEIASR